MSRVRDLDDAEGWSEFDKLYRPLLLEYALRRGLGVEEAEEVAQRCLTAIVDRIGKFKRRLSFRGWLRGMVHHKVADLLKEQGRTQRADSGLLRQTPDRELSPTELWQQQWNHAHLHFLIRSLRGDFAKHTLQAFTMYVLHGREVRDIGKLLGMTANQVYVAKSRVLRKIRESYPDLLESLYGAGQ